MTAIVFDELCAGRHAQQVAYAGFAEQCATQVTGVVVGAVIKRSDLAVAEGDADRQRGDRLRHRLRNKAMLRRARVLIALYLHHAVLDDQQAHDALPGEIVVNRQIACITQRPAKRWFVVGAGQGHRVARRRHDLHASAVHTSDFALRRKRTDAHAFRSAPVLCVSNRIILGLAELVLIGGSGRKTRRAASHQYAEPSSRSDGNAIHERGPAGTRVARPRWMPESRSTNSPVVVRAPSMSHMIASATSSGVHARASGALCS